MEKAGKKWISGLDFFCFLFKFGKDIFIKEQFLLKRKKVFAGAVVLSLVFAAVIYDMTFNFVDWRLADRTSVGLAPLPAEEKEAVVQLYAARTYNWRKYFAVHSWIAVKEKNADSYTVYQVLGFKQWRTGNAVDVQKGVPDRRWYGAEPELLQDLRGEVAEKAIKEIKKAVGTYPYKHIYSAFPGPNSNTFISHIIRNVPELTVELPPTALGKDFLGYTKFFDQSESGTGYQFSVLGLLGITLGKAEGFEFNVLGLVFGVDVMRPALKLPFVGRIGMKDA